MNKADLKALKKLVGDDTAVEEWLLHVEEEKKHHGHHVHAIRQHLEGLEHHYSGLSPNQQRLNRSSHNMGREMLERRLLDTEHHTRSYLYQSFRDTFSKHYEQPNEKLDELYHRLMEGAL